MDLFPRWVLVQSRTILIEGNYKKRNFTNQIHKIMNKKKIKTTKSDNFNYSVCLVSVRGAVKT